MLNLKRFFHRKPKPEPEQKKDELPFYCPPPGEKAYDPDKPINNMCDLFWYTTCDTAKSFIDSFCPWVKIEELSREEIIRFSKASNSLYAALEGWTTLKPEDEQAIENLVPKPTNEQFESYFGSIMGRPLDEYLEELEELVDKKLAELEDPEDLLRELDEVK